MKLNQLHSKKGSRFSTVICKVFLLIPLVLTGLSLSGVSEAQNRGGVLHVTLSDLLNMANDNNYQIRISDSDSEAAKARFRQTNAVFLPQISAEISGTTTTDPVNAFGFKLKQEAFTEADFNTDILNNPDRTDHFSTKFELKQPILNPSRFYDRASAKDNFMASRQEVSATREWVRYMIKQAYYQLIVSIEQINAVESALKTAGENHKDARNLFEQGMISKADLLAAGVRELEVEKRLIEARNLRSDMEDQLRFLIGMKDERTVLPAETLDDPDLRYVSGLRESEFKENSLTRSLSFRKDAAENRLRSGKFSFLPSINAFGVYEMNDDVFPGSQGNNYTIGASLRWNLFSGFEKAGKVMQSKAELNRIDAALEQKIEEQKLEIRKAERALGQAQKQLEIAEASIEQASEDFRIRSDRYSQGLEKTSDLLAAEASLLRSRLQRLRALFLIHDSISKLELIYENSEINS